MSKFLMRDSLWPGNQSMYILLRISNYGKKELYKIYKDKFKVYYNRIRSAISIIYN
jgi:hypothetical protein